MNKRFSVSPESEVPLLIRRARELMKRAGERESVREREKERERIEGPVWFSAKVTVE